MYKDAHQVQSIVCKRLSSISLTSQRREGFPRVGKNGLNTRILAARLPLIGDLSGVDPSGANDHFRPELMQL
jgi:hypothetical protein